MDVSDTKKTSRRPSTGKNGEKRHWPPGSKRTLQLFYQEAARAENGRYWSKTVNIFSCCFTAIPPVRKKPAPFFAQNGRTPAKRRLRFAHLRRRGLSFEKSLRPGRLNTQKNAPFFRSVFCLSVISEFDQFAHAFLQLFQHFRLGSIFFLKRATVCQPSSS